MSNLITRIRSFWDRRRSLEAEQDYQLEKGELRDASNVTRAGQDWVGEGRGAGESPVSDEDRRNFGF